MIVFQIIAMIAFIVVLAIVIHYIFSAIGALFGVRITNSRGSTVGSPEDFKKMNKAISDNVKKGVEVINKTKEEVKKRSVGNYKYIITMIQQQQILPSNDEFRKVTTLKKLAAELNSKINLSLNQNTIESLRDKEVTILADLYNQLHQLQNERDATMHEYNRLREKIAKLDINKLHELNKKYFNFDTEKLNIFFLAIGTDNTNEFSKILKYIESESWMNNITKDEATKAAYYLFNHFNDPFKKSTGLSSFY